MSAKGRSSDSNPEKSVSEPESVLSGCLSEAITNDQSENHRSVSVLDEGRIQKWPRLTKFCDRILLSNQCLRIT